MITREDVQPPVSLLRFFAEGREWGDPYQAVMTLTWDAPDVVHALGFNGQMTPSLYRELAQWFKDNGVKFVKAARGAGHTMPGAREQNGEFVFDVDAYCARAGL